MPNKNYYGTAASYLILLIAITSVTSPVSGQAKLIADQYLRIKPSISTKADVETILGIADTTAKMATYITGDESVWVFYSSGACGEKNGGPWNLPEWTVTEVSYSMRDKIVPLSLVINQLSKFKRRREGDVLTFVKYYDDESGISVTYDTKDKRVSDVTLKLSKKQRALFQCIN
jgi:hypothetical protein